MSLYKFKWVICYFRIHASCMTFRWNKIQILNGSSKLFYSNKNTIQVWHSWLSSLLIRINLEFACSQLLRPGIRIDAKITKKFWQRVRGGGVTRSEKRDMLISKVSNKTIAGIFHTYISFKHKVNYQIKTMTGEFCDSLF